MQQTNKQTNKQTNSAGVHKMLTKCSQNFVRVTENSQKQFAKFSPKNHGISGRLDPFQGLDEQSEASQCISRVKIMSGVIFRWMTRY